MSEGEEIIQQDANTVQEPSEPAVHSTQQAEQSPAPSPESTQSPQAKPFHEDPRIQEYIERQVRKQAETYEQKMAEFQRQSEERFRASQPQPQKPVNEFVQKLREINPAYADYIEGLERSTSKVAEIEQRLQQQESERIRTEYTNTLSRLHTESKVPNEQRDLIEQLVEAQVVRNPKLGLRDVPSVYKDVQTKVSQLMEAQKRATTASYVADKAKDSAVPASQPKGKAPARNEKGQFSHDREMNNAEMTKQVLKQLKAGKDF